MMVLARQKTAAVFLAAAAVLTVFAGGARAADFVSSDPADIRADIAVHNRGGFKSNETGDGLTLDNYAEHLYPNNIIVAEMTGREFLAFANVVNKNVETAGTDFAREAKVFYQTRDGKRPADGDRTVYRVAFHTFVAGMETESAPRDTLFYGMLGWKYLADMCAAGQCEIYNVSLADVAAPYVAELSESERAEYGSGVLADDAASLILTRAVLAAGGE